ncbi:unnamed protein product [Meganyctiphanes norvegica]|uniref:Uncharacterized protein n=1 Tax=Meganyctiphanes norvegica TaxID=48144 RepID=A0AAV2PN78_MEGNR
MIHCIYENMSLLLFNIMKNFLTNAALTVKVDGHSKAKEGCELASLDINMNRKKLEKIEVGTRAREILNDFSVNSESREVFFRKCMAFYTASTKYLMAKLPLKSQFLKDAQYLHPEKRNFSSALNAISRISLEIANLLKNYLQSVFSVPDTTNVSELVDMIRSQWQSYQLCEIPKDWYTIETNKAKKDRLQRQSYWKEVERTWIAILPKEQSGKIVRIDSYWSKVFGIRNEDGACKFVQLSALVKEVLILSHGNAGPEQGFSINKSMIDAHGTKLGEDVLIALRRVKHRILQVGGIQEFEITRALLESVKQSRSRYEEELRSKEKEKSKNVKEKDAQKESELYEIENDIKLVEKGIEVAEKAISDGSNKLDQHLSVKNVNTEKIRADNALIQMGLERKKKLNDDLSNLIKKKKKLKLTK